MLSEEVSEGGVAELLQQELPQENPNTPRGLFRLERDLKL